jgi:decaprenyl-phosphate phosphoribosyltransferase
VEETPQAQFLGGEAYAHVPVPVSSRLSAGVLLRACRPRQWSKNLLVLAAPAAAGVIDRPLVAAQAAGALVVMCLLSSATYLLNDVRDVAQDRLHPRKRSRPVAAGEMPPRAALLAAAALALTGIILATAIAAGFVLRALAGGVATDIYLSRWFVIVTGCCAIFLVAAKRYAELREQTGSGVAARTTLRRYSLGHLRLTLLTAATIACVAYTGWAFTRPAHVIWYGLSIVPFALWLSRYAALIGDGAGQAPEELILRDRTLLALSLLWSFLFLGGVYVGH